jgi:hypothetical protein
MDEAIKSVKLISSMLINQEPGAPGSGWSASYFRDKPDRATASLLNLGTGWQVVFLGCNSKGCVRIEDLYARQGDLAQAHADLMQTPSKRVVLVQALDGLMVGYCLRR